MANCSDAYGTITVNNVGEEFLTFLKDVQGDEEKAYYKLVENEDVRDVKPDSNNCLSFNFSTMGRWSYGNNLEGYLDGKWMNDEPQGIAYASLVNAMKEVDGSITVDYTDSDAAMDWMGKGVATLTIIDDFPVFVDGFHSESLDITKYAEMNGYSIFEAFDMLHGEEPAEKWDEYVQECKANGVEPKDPQVWYDNDFDWE